VRKFYEVIWNKRNKEVVPYVLHESFKFRGSLGSEKIGHDGFIEYLDMVHAALGDYRCEIKELVSEKSKVFAKMQFSGTHKGEFMGVNPTGRHLVWDGAALFHFKNGKADSLWVLGDVVSLQAQLNENQT
jgi:predicted ester cyclase